VSKGKDKASTGGEASGADGLAMATMDIFAGCGGLSEGMHQAGVADTKWAIEYESPAADAFKLNNPDAEVFCANCNVILRVRVPGGTGLAGRSNLLSPAAATCPLPVWQRTLRAPEAAQLGPTCHQRQTRAALRL
jgi:hypothetical protein